MSKLVKPINEYFNTFNDKDYTIYVDGTPAEWCGLDGNIDARCVTWNIMPNSNARSWYWVKISDIGAIKLAATTMEIITTDGKEYKLTAKLKTKEEKVKDIILRAKKALFASNLSHVSEYLDELNTLMDEAIN